MNPIKKYSDFIENNESVIAQSSFEHSLLELYFNIILTTVVCFNKYTNHFFFQPS